MPLFGEFEFGAELFGDSGINEILKWGLQIDWADDGYFDGSNEGYGRMYNFESFRGREFFLSSGTDGFQKLAIGRATCSLDNQDERFNPTNSDSPLYGNLEAGKVCSVIARDGLSGSTYNVFTGLLSGIEPIGRDDWSRVKLTLDDGWEFLRTNASVDITQDQRVDQLMGLILDDIGWPTRWGRSLGVASNTVPYFWSEGRSARELLHELNSYEYGNTWLGPDGVFNFRSRHETDSVTAALTQDLLLAEVGQRAPWETVRNIVTVYVYPKVEQSTGVLWSMEGETPSLSANGGSLTRWATFAYGNEFDVPATSVETLVGGTDYVANSQADGGGTNLTSSISVVQENFSSSSKLVVTNNHATLDAYITTLQVRGDALTSPNRQFQLAQTGDYVTKPKSFTLDNRWMQDQDEAASYVDFIADLLAASDPFPIIRIEHRPSYQLAIDLFDRISLAVAELEINTNYRVGGIRHQWKYPTGISMVTTLYLEPFPQFGSFWSFPAEIGVSTSFPY